jgi:hypothetical protein
MRLLPTVLSTAVFFGGAAVSAALAQDPPSSQPPATEKRDQTEKHDVEVNKQRDANAPRDARVRIFTRARSEQQRKGAFLGVGTSPPTPILREQLKLSEGMGLVVEVVEKDSPAEQAGIKRYDVLTKLEDQLLVNAEQLAVLVRSRKPGDEVELTVVRGGSPTQVKAKLIERELTPLEDAGFFFHGAGPDGRGILDWQVRQMPPEVRQWWVDHRPDKGKAPGAEGHADAEAHGSAEAHGDARAEARARNGQSVTSWTDGEYTLTVSIESNKPGRHLVAKDRHGTVLFDGDVDAAGALDRLPTIVKEKLKKMEAAGVKPPKAPEPSEETGHLLPTDDANGV